jgi:hypothetical protein
MIQRTLCARINHSQARELRHRYDKARVKATYDNLPADENTVDLGISHYNPTTFFIDDTYRQSASAMFKAR